MCNASSSCLNFRSFFPLERSFNSNASEGNLPSYVTLYNPDSRRLPPVKKYNAPSSPTNPFVNGNGTPERNSVTSALKELPLGVSFA